MSGPKLTTKLFAVEVRVGDEYVVLDQGNQFGAHYLCVYETRRDAQSEANHHYGSRVVVFGRRERKGPKR